MDTRGIQRTLFVRGSRSGLAVLACAAMFCMTAAADTATRPWLDGWRAAVARGDTQAVADAVKWPFLFEGRALDRAAFVRQAWPALFNAKLRGCWSRAKPVAESGDMTLTCAPYTLYFEPASAGGGWVLREFNADGER